MKKKYFIQGFKDGADVYYVVAPLNGEHWTTDYKACTMMTYFESAEYGSFQSIDALKATYGPEIQSIVLMEV
jgi:hypothetical protein